MRHNKWRNDSSGTVYPQGQPVSTRSPHRDTATAPPKQAGRAGEAPPAKRERIACRYRITTDRFTVNVSSVPGLITTW